MSYLQQAMRLIIETGFGILLLAYILRFIFQLSSVDFRNQIAQLVVKLTQFPLSLFRKYIPGLFGIDLASVVIIIIIASIKTTLLLLVIGKTSNLAAIVIYSIGTTLNVIVWIYIITIIARAIMSWFPTSNYHPAISVLNSMTEPILRFFRRLLPNLQGLDLSPLLALLALNLIQLLVVYPIIDFGSQLG